MDYAVSKVVDAGVSSLLQAMIDTLTPSTFLQSIGFIFDFGVKGEAKKLSSTLSRIQDILGDAEERQIKDKVLCGWLSDLKDVAYEAEDILDELEAMVLRAKLEAPRQTRKRKLSEVFSRPVSNLSTGTRIKEVREKLEKIEREGIDRLHLTVIRNSERLIPAKRPPAGSIVDETIVFGRGDDKEKVLGLLTSDGDSPASDSSKLKVVPICGMGGLGKTTLAQLIYNDELVEKHFNLKAWVYVSEDFDLIRIARAIAEKVSGSENAPHLTDFDAIQVCIQNALQEKRFLLVLDDVWNENRNVWDPLLAPLSVGARGSAILVTTRSRRVSSILRTVPTHFLQGLPYDDSWSLFKRRAFVEGNSDAHPDLVKVGEKIVKKCNGLPLAVKTLGGLLHSKVDVVDWKAILTSEIWDLPEEQNDILPALRLSYHHLPAHLKRCFAYCGRILRNGLLDTVHDDKIVNMWMAQGFIHSKDSMQMVDIGKEYLADLVSRSLLNCREHSSYLFMHDLTRDLARSILGNDFLEIGDGKPDKNVEKVRHLTLNLLNYSTESFNFKDLHCSKNLRSFWLHSSGRSPKLDCMLTIPADFFIYLRHLRILDLRHSLITQLPDSIGNLLQLRYLDLSYTSIERLPKSTTRLYNLQTLILDSCEMLVELPSDLSNLVNLRYLSLEECSVSMVPRIGRLTSLRKLKKFTVGKEIGCRINELKDMKHLEGSLAISNLENVVSVEEAKEAALKKKLKINELELEWNSNNVRLQQEGIEEEVINALLPQTDLKKLNITGYPGVRFPTWLGDSSLSKLTEVELSRCRCRRLPPFGQLPSLTHLSLVELYELKKVGREFYGDGTVRGFPSLKQLDLLSIPDLEEWSVLEGDFSQLDGITISDCSKLRVLRRSLCRLSTIRDLYLSGCDQQVLSSLQYLTSLSSLEIDNFPNLTSPPHGLQRLTSLHSLKISNCPRLTSLYDAVLPATRHRLQNSNCSNPTCFPKGLKRLRLLFCPEIHSLPEELPTTLQSIFIEGCPLLKEKYQEGGEYWCKISHIPRKFIF